MYQVLAYYKYVHIENAEAFAAEHLEWCKRNGIKGRIYVADEGINGQLSGRTEDVQRYIETMRADARFADADFKVDDTDKIAFVKTHVRYKPEIVNSGLRELGINPAVKTAPHMKAQVFREKLKKGEIVALDVRSNYETGIGRFKNAITLDIETFREFPDKVKELEHLKGKTIVTYCTGGIKCEKASAWLLEQGFEDVHQLEGGVIRYAKETGGEDFEGQLYVFDGRVVADVNHVNPSTVSACKFCGVATARIVNCANALCNDKFVLCEACGWEHAGACSDACRNAPTARPYNGLGYYPKPYATM